MTVHRHDAERSFWRALAASRTPSRCCRCCWPRPRPRSTGRACGQLHTAVVQVILAARPTLVGPCGDAWVGQWIALPDA